METSKLSVKGMAVAGGVFGGGGMLLVALLNMNQPEYGQSFLQMMSSLYSPYDGQATLGSALTLAACGLFDGVISGTAFALIYNLVLGAYKKRG